jgi:hypothetical protein
MTQKNKYIDVYITAVPEVSIAVALKDITPPWSFILILPHENVQ